MIYIISQNGLNIEPLNSFQTVEKGYGNYDVYVNDKKMGTYKTKCEIKEIVDKIYKDFNLKELYLDNFNEDDLNKLKNTNFNEKIELISSEPSLSFIQQNDYFYKLK